MTEAARIEINISAPGAEETSRQLGKVDEKVNELPKSLQGLSKATVEAFSKFGKATADAFNKLSSATVAVGDKMRQLSSSFDAFKQNPIIQAMGSIQDSLMSSVNAFGEAQSAMMRLEAVAQMKGMSGATGTISALANEIQNLTGASGDLTTQLAAELLAQGKTEAQIKKMIKAAADLSAVTGDSLASSIEQLNMTLSGTARGLGRTNPAIAAMTKEQLQAGEAIEYVAKAYDGMAEKMKNSIEVSNKIKDEALGDLTESIGQFFAPAVMVANEALIAFATVGQNVLGVVNQMPEPFRVLLTATAALTAGIVALSVAQSVGLIGQIKAIAVNAVNIAKTIAQTVATWALSAATWAAAIAQAALNPANWAGVAAAIALSAAVVGVTIALASQTTAVKESGKEITKTTQHYLDLYAAAKKWDDRRKQDSKAADDRALENIKNEQQYNAERAKSAKALTDLKALQNSGFIGQKEALEKELKLNKDLLELTRQRATQTGNFKAYAGDAAAYLKKIEDIEKRIENIGNAEKVNDNFRKTMENLNQMQEEAADLWTEQSNIARGQFKQTMEWLDELQETSADAWIDSVAEIKEQYQSLFDIITTGLGSIQTLANNGSRQEIMNLEEKAKLEQKEDDDRFSALKAQGIVGKQLEDAQKNYDERKIGREQALEAEKKRIDRDAAIRAKAFAIFEATLKLPLLVMQGIALPAPFGGAIGGAIYGALGALQLAAASSTPIPSAQFGGDFVVPPGYQGDSGLVRVNSGEKVSVEPVRNSGSDTKRVTVSIGSKDFEGYLQEVLNSGRITIRRQGVVKYA